MPSPPAIDVLFYSINAEFPAYCMKFYLQRICNICGQMLVSSVLLKESLTFVSCPDPPSSREVRCLVSQASILGPTVSIEALYLGLQIDQCEFHKITLSGMIEVLVSPLINAAMQSHLSVHISGAIPKIWTSDTKLLLLM